MIMINYYLEALKKYAVFSGRSGRAEYWYFFLGNLIIQIILKIITSIFGSVFDIAEILYFLFIFIPSLSVGIRRLHDIGKSGWTILIGLIPVIGFIWLIVLLATKGNTEENKYGPPPNITENNHQTI